MNKTKLYTSNLLLVSLASLLLTTVSLESHAGSTLVTDANGTQELWTFQEILGSQKLTSKINQTDGKGVTQTWDANGNVLTRIDAEGRKTTYTYNATNQKESMTEAADTALARTTLYEYVSADIDLINKITEPSIVNGQVKETITAYDVDLNIESVTINGFAPDGTPISRTTQYDYNTNGQVTEINGPRADVNDISTLTYYICSTGSECGQLSSVENASGHTTTYDEYDANARLIKQTDANGTQTSYTYHPRGWLLTQTEIPTSGAIRVTTNEYDPVGQLIKTTLPDGTEQNYVYDAAHDLREISDNLGNKIEYIYDTRGNRVQELIKDPDGTLVRSTTSAFDMRNYVKSINNDGSITQLDNDATGNVSIQTDPNLNPTTDSSYDALNRLETIIDALTNSTAYQYNVADQLIQVDAPNGATTNYQYDDLGNLVKEISADRGTIVYTHDAAGNVLTHTDARGITTSYQYDELNRLTVVTYPDISENITYSYDANCVFGVGRLCQVEDDSGLTQYQYDAWGNITRTEKQEHDDAGVSIDTYITDYEYDSGNRVLKTTYPSGREITYSRDAVGRLTGISSLDSDGQIESIISDRVYRADGYWTEQTYANGLVQTRDYDLQGRIQSHDAGSYSRDYSYDNNGNILNASAQDNSHDVGYDYDALDRLTLESDAISTLLRGFDYDANGNREQLTENALVSTLNYTPNSNRLETIDSIALNIDASGRTLSDTQGRSYAYNDAGRVHNLSVNGQLKGQYTYNSQQLRTRKVAASETTIYHYSLSGDLIAESDDQGNLIQEYIYADGERVATFAKSDGGGGNTELPESLDLGAHIAYGGAQDQSSTGNVDLSNTNKTIARNSNRWREVSLNYTITANTVLEFDFSATTQGEIHGIGLDSDLGINSNRTFALYGTQSWGISAFKNYQGSGTTHYTIPVGQFYQGAVNYLGLTMDDDANKAGNSQFSEIKIYEAMPVSTDGIIDLSSFQSYGGSQDGANTGSVSIIEDGALRLKGNRWQKIYAPISLTPTTELHFQFKSDTQGEIHGIGVDTDNGINSNLTFGVWGTQNWGNRDQYGYSGAGEYQSYQIPIGQFITGSYNYITFTMDDDANSNAESVFKNVQFVDPNAPSSSAEASVQFYVNDHLGTPQKLVDQDNGTTWEAQYEAFGAATVVTELVTNNHRFPGQYFDAESGLYYNWHRYYDPATGRYIASDPIGLRGGINTYGYVGARPLVYFDPDGLKWVFVGWTIEKNSGWKRLWSNWVNIYALCKQSKCGTTETKEVLALSWQTRPDCIGQSACWDGGGTSIRGRNRGQSTNAIADLYGAHKAAKKCGSLNGYQCFVSNATQQDGQNICDLLK